VTIPVRCACGRDCSFGEELSGQTARCYGCGAEVKVPVVGKSAAPAPAKCPSCGGVNRPEARECRWCRKSLVPAAAPAPAGPAVLSDLVAAVKRTAEAGRDTGVPWEDRDGNVLSTWWRTWWGSQFGRDGFWSRMPWEGGFGAPMRFALLVPVQVLAAAVVCGGPLLLLNLMSIRDRTVQGVGLGVGCVMIGLYAFSLFAGTLLGTFVWAGFFHVMAKLFGGRGSFEASYRCTAYLYGTALWFLVPVLGVFLQAGGFVLGMTHALSRAHAIPRSRALLAALLPVLVVFGGLVLVWILILVAALSASPG